MSQLSKETGGLELGPTTRQQTAMFDSMKLLMESMERRDAARRQEERKLEEEREGRRRKEEQEKEDKRQEDALERDRAHELRLMSIIRDLDKVKKEETEKLLDRQKKLVSIPKWTDEERPANYLWKFEQAMTCNKEPKIRWAELLPLYLTGNASTVYTARVSADVMNDYEAIKTILLDSFGDTVQQARKDWWTLRKLQGESPEELVIRIEGKIKRGLDGCDSIMDATAMITLSRFLSILPSDVSTFVLGRNPKSAMEAAHMASEFQALHSWKAKPTYSSRYDRRDENPSYRSDRSEGRKDASSSALGTARGGGQNRQQQGFSERNKTRTESYSNNSERPITCYGCGEKGHKRPDCPKRVRRVRSPQPKHAFMVQGKIGEIECKKMVLDSGSDITIINSKLITDDQLTGETVTVHTVDDRPIHFPLARVCLNVGNYSIDHVVAVSHTIKDDALLGVDLENFRDLMRLGVCQEMEKATPIRVQQTRKQAAEQEEQERLDDIATAQSGATLVDLLEVPDLDDSLFQKKRRDKFRLLRMLRKMYCSSPYQRPWQRTLWRRVMIVPC